VAALPSRPAGHRRSVCATCKPLPGACPNVFRSHHYSAPEPPRAPFWRAEQENTATYISPPCARVRSSHLRSALSETDLNEAYSEPSFAANMPLLFCSMQHQIC
jgi:hypothetical protein